MLARLEKGDVTPAPNDRRSRERRIQDRRTRLSAIQETHDDLRAVILRTAEQIRQLESEQKTQLVRIAQIQQEINELKKTK